MTDDSVTTVLEILWALSESPPWSIFYHKFFTEFTKNTSNSSFEVFHKVSLGISLRNVLNLKKPLKDSLQEESIGSQCFTRFFMSSSPLFNLKNVKVISPSRSRRSRFINYLDSYKNDLNVAPSQPFITIPEKSCKHSDSIFFRLFITFDRFLE